jgi:hypothetical protein
LDSIRARRCTMKAVLSSILPPTSNATVKRFEDRPDPEDSE